MSYPSLAALSLRTRNQLRPDAPSGLYCLDTAERLEPCDSSIILVRKAIEASQAHVQALDDFMSDPAFVAITPNKLGGYEKNPDGTFVVPDASTPSWKIARDAKTGEPRAWKLPVLRRQATFGPHYNFGQVNTVVEDRARWPALVRQCLEYAQQLAEQKGIARELYNGVHTNLYDSGKANLAPHKDAEPAILAGLPIFSFTFLNGALEPRPFSIYHPANAQNTKPEKVADIILQNGDLLIMQGSMQRWFLHGVESTAAKRFERARRLNLTVRALRPVEKRKLDET